MHYDVISASLIPLTWNELIYVVITKPTSTIEMTHESEFYCKTNVFSIKERALAVKGILIRLSLLAKCFSFSGWKPVGADLYAPLKISSSITLRSFALRDATVTFIFNVQSMSLTFNSCWVQHLLTLRLNLSSARYTQACCMFGRPEPLCHVPLMFDILFGRYSAHNVPRPFPLDAEGGNWAVSSLPEESRVSFSGHLFDAYHFLEFIVENWHWFRGWWMLRVPLLTLPLTVFSKFCI